MRLARLLCGRGRARLTAFERTAPDWVLGQTTHGPLSPIHWVSIASGGALRVISLADGSSHTVDTPNVAIPILGVVSPTQVVVKGYPATKPALISLLTLPSASEPTAAKGSVKDEILKSASSATVDPAFVSEGRKISYPTPDGATAYAIFYPPVSGSHEGPAGEVPPLVTRCHGGPTAPAHRGLDWDIAFFTSRGFAYVDVDYGGSTGASSALSLRVVPRPRAVDLTRGSCRVRQGVPRAPCGPVGRGRRQRHSCMR